MESKFAANKLGKSADRLFANRVFAFVIEGLKANVDVAFEVELKWHINEICAIHMPHVHIHMHTYVCISTYVVGNWVSVCVY